MAEKTIEPVFALHRITYGKVQTAPPNAIFIPVSEAEREELFKLNAVRELTEQEAKLFAAEPAAAETVQPPPDAGSEKTGGKTGSEKTGAVKADESPLG